MTQTVNVSAFSHLQLQTGQEAIFQETIEFYAALGFVTVKHTLAHSGSVAVKESVWLHLYPTSGSSDDTPLTIRLSLVDGCTAPAPSTPEGKEDAGPPANQLCLVSQDIPQLEAFLRERDLAFQHWDVTPSQSLASGDSDLSSVMRDDHRGAWVETTTRDPVGTHLVFTNRKGPFTVQLALPEVAPSRSSGSHSSRSVPETPAAPATGPDSKTAEDRPRRIGVLTSGGDAPGMNPAVRAVVRVSIARGCVPFAIYDGYQGLVDGGRKIRQMEWKDVHSFLPSGGTNIGTARCMAFKERAGRLQAAQNLIERGIDALVVIGGDGSLTGADVFRAEWPGLVDELVQQKRIASELAQRYRHLTIVGLVGSIDNDMASTDMTIGAVSSLHRICESVDAISSTAISHSRAFVIEVMGRHCGWLALMAGICTGADWLFIPERPPVDGEWQDRMCETLRQHREMGKRKSIIIISEGAIDSDLRPIKPDDIKDLLCQRLNLDTRVTLLGHVQRGGSPCAYDRFLATVQGVEAVEAVLRANPDTPSPMIGTRENRITCEPLMAAVELTHKVSKSIAKKDFQAAMELRSPDFADVLDAFQGTSTVENAGPKAVPPIPADRRLRMAIIHVGAPAGGMNPATRALVRYAINRGHVPLAINNGFPGLARGEVTELSWMDVDGWSVKGGSRLGTNRDQPTVDLGMVAFQLQQHNIQSLVIVGGFEAYTALVALNHHRPQYPAFCIPTVLIPATISNNVPGTDHSLGADTSLNALVEACDRIKQSASASRRRVFVVETQGGNCGYLATVGGLITGATTSYIPERGVHLEDIQRDVRHLRYRFAESNNSGLGCIVLRNEKCSTTYTTQVLSDILHEESQGLFDSKTTVLGHLLQGGTPSPLDRYRATRLAVRCVQWAEKLAWASLDRAAEAQKSSATKLAPVRSDINVTRSATERSELANSASVGETYPDFPGNENLSSMMTQEESRHHHHHQHDPSSLAAGTSAPEITGVKLHVGSSISGAYVPLTFHRPRELRPPVYTPTPDSATVIGIVSTAVSFTPVRDLLKVTDFKKRRATRNWWLPVHDLVSLFAKYGMYPGEEQPYESQQQAVTLTGEQVKAMVGSVSGQDEK
ncbi:6-phosphofructokinase, alpha subunit [Tieghemiomyces parasiticus]|uniref:ATP-dependent 6-phosphofructokinase n=1 Tax=Tieghemiomyces parasiticus TaxID=78921 RepID=A0A9W8AEI0_9FUNG|nr:6-phosphofructokinase, alpha subunit [Tieghemiomyces parasiticus]